MSLQALRESILTGIQAAYPDLAANCQTHGGRFDKTEFARWALKSPTVLVACLGVKDAADDNAGGVDVVAVMGIFVVTADRPQVQRDAGALAIVSALLLTVPGNRWGRTDTSYAEQVRAENLYSGAVDAKGMALWAIVWEQKITLGGLDPDTLDLFITFHADWDLAEPDGQIDAQDTVTLEQDN